MMSRGRSGNVALIFALLAPVLVLLTGGAVDIMDASTRRAQLQQALDAAAVASVARYSPGYEAANLMPAGGAVPDTVTATSTNGVFKANWTNPTDVSTPMVTGASCGGSTMVCRQGTSVNAVLNATANFNPIFLSIASIVPGFQAMKTIQLNVTSKATASTPTYVNYFIIVDSSQSMGIASTPTDMANLYNRVSTYNNGSGGEYGCVFGCHVQADNAYKPNKGFNSSYLQPYTNEDLAHNSAFGTPITLRIDSAKTAIQNIVSLAKQAAGGYANIQFALYTMSHDPTTGSYYKTISGLSSNYDAVSAAANNIDLGGNTMYGYGDTDFTDELNAFFPTEFTKNNISSNGDGSTPQNAQNYIFIITDGLSDNSGSTVNSHPTKAFDTTLCTGMKKEATVGVIYTTYLPITAQMTNSSGGVKYDPNLTTLEGNYQSLAQPYLPNTNTSATNVPNSLASCTSDASQYYFEASDGPTIINKMQQLFAATQKVAHISQ
jgi:Flp pilus assembly protein TadG